MSVGNRHFFLAAIIGLLGACGANNGTGTSSNNGTTTANNAASTNTATTGPTNNGTSTNGASNNDTTAPQATVFYHEHVKPIIDAKCSECHVAGGIGPFALDDYESVSAVAGLVKAAVVNETMPPFLYDTTCREPSFDPSLSEEQIQTTSDWVDQGAVEGDPAAAGAPLDIARPEQPTFDSVLTMPAEYTPVQSPDDYRCFVIDWPHDTTKYVTAFGVEPGQEAMVHHVIAFLARPDFVAQAEALDAAEEGPGYTCFGGPVIDDFYWLGSWAPGGLLASGYPEGTGLEIPAGSKVIVQVHYNTLIEDPRPDQTTIKFETADSVEKTAFWMPWANPLWLNGSMRIPAGEADVKHGFTYDPTSFFTDGKPIDIWAAGLHMHMLGTSARSWITRQGGEEACVADIPRWDFNWQSGVAFDEPVRFNPGDKLGLECHWDNTMENQPVVDGRRLTPQDRNWGEGSTDEMCLGVFYITIEEP